MRKIMLLLFVLPLMAADCRKKKESSKCHYTLTIRNSSNDSVCFGRKIESGPNYPGECYVTNKRVIHAGGEYLDQSSYSCWEDILSDKSYDYFVMHKDSFNNNLPTYPCDSLFTYNKVLRVIPVTLQNGQQNNFIYNYP